MQTRILAALLCGCALASAAVAETLVWNGGVQVSASQLERSKAGLPRDQGEKQFGAPAGRHPTGGGSSQAQPPITRWDYNGFSVVFERDRVVDSVVTGSSVTATSVAGT